MLSMLGTKPVLMAGAVIYLCIYCLGMPAMAVFNFGNAVLSAAGDTKNRSTSSRWRASSTSC